MSENRETYNGKIATFEEAWTSKTGSGFVAYKVTFENGQTYEMMVPPDAAYHPKIGDEIVMFKTSSDKWIIDKYQLPGQPKQKPPATNRGKGGDSNTYWTDKTNYEQSIRDPKIEFQFYHNQVRSTYTDLAPNLVKPPKTIEDMDALLDQAFAKAKQLFRAANPKEEVTKTEEVTG